MAERNSSARHSRRRPPASIDVARLVGVSQKTVSRVMNGEPHVKEELRRRVLRAAEELGYRRNGAARALISGRNDRIGVVSLGTALHGPASMLISLERAARRTGYALSVVHTAEGDVGGIAGSIDFLLGQGVDGIVLSEPIDDGPIDIDVDVPVLVLGRFSASGLRAPRVVSAEAPADTAARAATEHLLSLGHRTVVHVAGPQRWFSARDRLHGWRQALRDAGAEELPYVQGDWSAASGYAVGRRIVGARDVTAVFAANDDMAVGVMRAVTEAGLSVPDDVSVVGFDDIPLAAFLNPPLTTVSQPFDTVAESGLAALVRSIEHPHEPISTELAARNWLVVRGSTAAPPSTLRGRPPHAGAGRRRRPEHSTTSPSD